MQHRIKQYADGHKKIDYCTVCGKEGTDLLHEPECVVDKKNDNQSDFLIDSKLKRN